MKPHPEHDSHGDFKPRMLGRLMLVFFVLGLTHAVSAIIAHEESDGEQILQETLGVAHDELIMLIVSLVVIFEIIANFKYLRRLPYKYLFLSAFAAFTFSALFTVVESFVFETVLNYCEHLSFMIASILVALWCVRVFAAKKPEGSQ